LIKENEEVFTYIFKNVNPTSTWYDLKVRDGHRLLTLNGQDVTRIPYEHIYSSMIENKISFTCQVVWHPELYIELGEGYSIFLRADLKVSVFVFFGSTCASNSPLSIGHALRIQIKVGIPNSVQYR
jgi:hypothetical protein